MSSAEASSRLLTPREAAAFVGVNVGTLAKWRCLRSDGPRFVRVSDRAIRYDPADLQEFIDRSRHDSTSQYVTSTTPVHAGMA